MTSQAEPGTVELLDQTWQSIAGLCSGLDEAGFLTPTDCPGWTVKDLLSHILGTERTLRGEAVPDIDADADYVRNDLGRLNERWVATLRDLPGTAVLSDFRDVTAARTADLRRLDAAALNETVPTPFGEMTQDRWLNVRLFDCFSHEQDIRRALARPGNLGSEPAHRALQRGVRGLPRAVGRAARGMPDGTWVEVAVDGADGSPWLVTVADGRGALLAPADGAPDGAPDAALGMDLETFLLLVWGRVAPEIAEDGGRLRLRGDLDLGRRVAAGLNLTP